MLMFVLSTLKLSQISGIKKALDLQKNSCKMLLYTNNFKEEIPNTFITSFTTIVSFHRAFSMRKKQH